MAFAPEQLSSLVAVANSLSFTKAAEQLGLRQSTVSQHIRKLEEQLGHPLFVRDTRTVTLTADGEAMAGFARTILAANQDAVSYFTGSGVRGRLKFGVSDDLALTALPRVLREFRRLYPRVDLELTVAQSGSIFQRVESGHLDVAFVKHEPGHPRAAVVRRDRLVWSAADGSRLDPAAPVPLVVYQAPSLTRARSVQALESAGRSYRITCVVRGVNGVLAAVRAGLGLGVFARSLAPTDLVEIPVAAGLPELGEVDFVLVTSPGEPTDAANALIQAIMGGGRIA